MPQGIPAVTVTGVKQADGSVQLSFYNQNGGLRYSANIPNANFTSLNTTVNGGATGATLSFSYAQDANNVDYPAGYVGS